MNVIRTVTGDILGGDVCGNVLSHEHLWIDLRNQAASTAETRPVVAGDYASLMTDPYAMRDNLLVGDAAVAEEECRELLSLGCGLVVDCSTPQIGRAPEALRALSLSTGMRVVMGCGYYTGDTYPAEIAEVPAEKLAEAMIEECRTGVNGIRPGVLGEFGTSKDILPNERRALEAAALVHKATNLGVQVHIYPWCSNGLEAADILMKGGVAPEKIVICHSDVEPNRNYIDALLKLGVFVEFDNFGKEFTPATGASFAGGRFCPDTERTALFADLFRAGWGKQLLMTNDICLKCMLKRYGGKGYSHVLQTIPELMRKNGLPADEWQALVMHDNPIRFLAI